MSIHLADARKDLILARGGTEMMEADEHIKALILSFEKSMIGPDKPPIPAVPKRWTANRATAGKRNMTIVRAFNHLDGAESPLSPFDPTGGHSNEFRFIDTG